MKNFIRKATLASLSALVLASSAFAEPEMKSVKMNEDEIQNAIALFDRLEVAAISVNADCTETEAELQSTVKGFNRAHWTATFNDGYIDTAEVELEREEIQAAIELYNRIGVRGRMVDPITRVTTVKVKSRVCNLRPANWTASFEVQE